MANQPIITTNVPNISPGTIANANWSSNPSITVTGTSSSWTVYQPPMSISIGNGTLQEIDGELWWVRADGSKSCLTGKSNNFKQIYDILNEDGK